MVSPVGVFQESYNLSKSYGMSFDAAQIGKPDLKERQSHVSQCERGTSGTPGVSEEFSFGQRPESKDYCPDSGSRRSFPELSPRQLLKYLIDCIATRSFLAKS